MSNLMVGFEFEFLVPEPSNRRQFACDLARKFGCNSTEYFHLETNRIQGSIPVDVYCFSKGFALRKSHQSQAANPMFQIVDDITIWEDLSHDKLSDGSFFKLVAATSDILEEFAPSISVSCAFSDVFSSFENHPNLRVEKEDDHSIHLKLGDRILLSATRPRGDRERVCEIVTAPFLIAEAGQLAPLLNYCFEAGLKIPVESATHMHIDGASFANTNSLQNLIRCIDSNHERLRTVFRTNTACRKLGRFPQDFLTVCLHPDFLKLSWPAAKVLLLRTSISKWHDVNIMNLLASNPKAQTVEFRGLSTHFSPDYYQHVISYMLNMLREYDLV